MLVGGGMGFVLALFWVFAILLVALSGERPGLSLKGCLFALALIAVVLVSTAGFYLAGGPTGAIIGAVTGYLAAFVVYGAHLQRTTGWSAWFRSQKRTEEK
jgi:hypothetical protein